MSQVASELKKIYEEDVSANGSVSEAFFLKLAASMNWLIENAGDYLGKIEVTPLSEAQFAALKGYSTGVSEYLKKWVLLKGQSIAGSKYHSTYGVSTLPNMVDNGAHIEQANSGAGTLTYFLNQNKIHGHSLFQNRDTGNYGGASAYANPPLLSASKMSTKSAEQVSGVYWLSSDGGNVARPNSVTFNIFLKIND